MRTPIALATLLLAVSAVAQETPVNRTRPDQKPRPPAGEAPRGDPDRPGARAELADRFQRLKDSGISAEEMRKLRAALETAREDEAVKAARAEADLAREATRTALQSFAKSKGVEQPQPPRVGERRERPSPERLAEMRKAMEGARNDPAVKAAFEQSKVAGAKLRSAVRDAVMKADPSLGATLEKMGDLREDFLSERLRDGAARGQRPEGVSPKGPRPEGASPKGPRPEGPSPKGPRPDSFESSEPASGQR